MVELASKQKIQIYTFLVEYLFNLFLNKPDENYPVHNFIA